MSLSPSHGRGRVVRAGGVATVAATIACVGVYFVGRAFVQYLPSFEPLASVWPTVIATVIYTLGAVGVYALVLRFARRPVRVYLIVAAVAFVVTLIPVFAYIPGEPGATAGQTAILALMHLVAAAVIVPTLLILAPPAR